MSDNHSFSSQKSTPEKERKIKRGYKSPGVDNDTVLFKERRAAFATQYRQPLIKAVEEWTLSKKNKNSIINPPEAIPLNFYLVQFYLNQLKSLYERPTGVVYWCGLDNETGTCVPNFERVLGLPSNIISVVTGSIHSLTLTDEGTLYSWGDNCEGQCGRAWWELDSQGNVDTNTSIDAQGKIDPNTSFDMEEYVDPDTIFGSQGKIDTNVWCNILTPYLIELDERIIAVSAGVAHTLALSLEGTCYFFGTYRLDNGDYVRNIGKDPKDPIYDLEMIEYKKNPNIDIDSILKPPKGRQFIPIKISIPEKVIKIDCGFNFNAVLTRHGTCYSWGIGQQFGRSYVGKYDFTPKPISWFDEDYLARSKCKRIVRDVACGGHHILVVAQDCPSPDWSVYSAGENNYGQLGLGFDTGRTVRKDAKGNDIKDEDGNDAYIWTGEPKVLTKIPYLEKKNIAYVAAGEHHSLCLDMTRRNLYSFGRNAYGQLGIISSGKPLLENYECIPQPVYLNPINNNRVRVNPVIRSISCGDFHNLVVTEDGDLYTWGFGEGGMLGNGDENDSPLPKKVNLSAKVLEARGGINHSLILVEGTSLLNTPK